MKKLLALLLTFMLLVQLPAPVAFASFDTQDAGARAPGMADAFTAIADDADSIVYNPAGLIQLQEGQLTSQYGQLVKGLDDGSSLGTTYLGYAHPLIPGYRALGFGYHNFKGDNLFNERTLILSYGQRLDLEPYGLRGIYSIGGNFKQLHRQYEPDRYTENAINDAGVGSNQRDQLFTAGNSKDTYAVDFGGLMQFGPKYQYTAGVALINVNQPDVSLGGDGDKAPLSVKAGVAYRPRWGTVTIESRQTERLVGQKDSDIALGGERNIPFGALGALIVRGGYATGSRGYRALTTGLSYLYSRFRLDYSFSFPIGNFADTGGTHRIGFSFKTGSGAAPLTNDYSTTDLLSAFTHDSLTDHVLLTRLSIDRGFTPVNRDQLMLLLVRKYPLDDPGLRDVRSELRDLLHRNADNGIGWSQLKMSLIAGVPDTEKENALQALEMLVRNDAKSALMHLSLVPIPVQKGDRISGITVLALGELAAQAYRKQELDNCIDHLRRIVEIMPSDEVVLSAYRDLLSRRAKISEAFKTNEQKPIQLPEPTPEAPPTLVAPKLQEEKQAVTPEQAKTDKADETLRAFGSALGYYMVRKAANASHEELIALLNQMKALYGGAGIDMSLVDQELAALTKPAEAKPITPAVVTPVEKPAAKPESPTVKPAFASPKTAPHSPRAKGRAKAGKPIVLKPMPIPAPKPVAAQRPAASTSGFKIPANADLKRAWEYYDEVAARDITDYERVELLKDMLHRFGEQGAEKINKELGRIRRRLE